MLDHVKRAMGSAQSALNRLVENEDTLGRIAEAGELFTTIFQNKGTVYSCGNGGSMCDAMHFAEELSGKFRQPRASLPAMAISDPAHLSCAANDFGYEEVFSRFVDAHGRPGDGLLAISTSGTSMNIIKAVEVAKERNMKVVVLTGKEDCPLGAMANIHICTPSGTSFSDRVQELHIKVIHTLIELVERRLFPENYS